MIATAAPSGTSGMNENQPAANSRRRKRRKKCWRASTCRKMRSISFPQRMVPGSSLIVSDHGLGDETGEGTDFIVVTR